MNFKEQILFICNYLINSSVEYVRGSTGNQSDFSNFNQRIDLPIAYSLQPTVSIRSVGRIVTFILVGQISFFSGILRAGDTTNLTSLQMQGAIYLDAMSIPCPGEIFAAINKVSRPNWSALARGGNAPVTTNRAQLALAVGILVTNGYIAVEAQDGQQVKNIGRDIMTMSKALGVGQNILSRGNNLIEFADHNQWDSLRNELEATENEVKTTMVEQQDRNLVTLTSAGAWLRGLEVAADIITKHYSTEGAALLCEPELARHLAADLEVLPEKLRSDLLVIRAKNTLNNVAALLEKERHAPSKETLLAIKADTEALIKAIDQT